MLDEDVPVGLVGEPDGDDIELVTEFVGVTD